ncbi:terminal quinol oxidase subunit [Haloarcula marismortui ATCC 43049]|uniref:DoxX family protein n=1 Tax=Haloarcula marismortui (strain ATCC 43049 / DSM 3752 / JCM 8966 / VKM B-1809) TaxID=272569 RepID=Q5V4V1_HALMA|nr:DoxX family protein [Haloarcula marismortui]AAV45451.1 terminal quinol oxidase subunit [Haloarcula marismortui ATCC 43049]QCP93222.1 DoxX family protein [Haloarcula marismortui ATCC 43049]
MAFESAGAGELFLLGRLLFGGVLAFMGLNHFQNAGQMAPYAEAKGLPAPVASVYGSGGLLLVSGVLVILGAYPVIAAGALATFLVASAVMMHNFWAVPDDQMQDEMTQFLKNIALAGGALSLLAVAGTSWPYTVGLSLF